MGTPTAGKRTLPSDRKAAAIHWFRRDLRLDDNPALAAASALGVVVPVFIWAPEEEAPWQPGAASRWWLHHSLEALDADLQARGSRLIIRRGPSLETLLSLVRETGAEAVHWNRLYEPSIITRDRQIKCALREDGIEAMSFNGHLLREPHQVESRSGGPYKVFTPFWKALSTDLQVVPQERTKTAFLPAGVLNGLGVEELGLLPKVDWAGGLREAWRPGEAGALRALSEFKDAAAGYEADRDYPAKQGTSRLSPHLHFGEVSPQRVWQEVVSSVGEMGAEPYVRQLGWRDFAHHLLYHFPRTAEQALRPEFEEFPWSGSEREFRAWQKGQTGFPIVDAGMRELWRTGWMHNRVRMVAASFLVKDLLIDWREGARWFWETLVDADLANNTLGWQWAAGCGADAAPYFRIFNPHSQAKKFDPEGEYVARWIPELNLGYAEPIVDHAQARLRALKAFEKITRAARR